MAACHPHDPYQVLSHWGFNQTFAQCANRPRTSRHFLGKL
jgi:hypothetical protein